MACEYGCEAFFENKDRCDDCRLPDPCETCTAPSVGTVEVWEGRKRRRAPRCAEHHPDIARWAATTGETWTPAVGVPWECEYCARLRTDGDEHSCYGTRAEAADYARIEDDHR